jgi:hypothetical protein
MLRIFVGVIPLTWTGLLEAPYRFLNNDQVTFDAVHAPHLEATRARCARCAAQRRVIVLHDRTVMKFSGEREGLGRTQTSLKAFSSMPAWH